MEVKVLGSGCANCRNPVALIEKAAPAIQGHLDRAKQIQTKLSR